MASIIKTEPQIDTAATGAVTTADAPPPPAATAAAGSVGGAKLDQLSRVEDKTARIEEKFARSEERMMRVESALEKATIRLEGATQDMNLQGVRDDVARLRDAISRKPGTATIFVIALVSALIGAAVAYALLRYGIPGLAPRVIPS
jgi:hypothetical protein